MRQLREAAGLSLRDLARQIGEEHSNIRYWEQSGNLPRSNVLVPMAKALGVTVEELLGESRPKRVVSPGGRSRQLFAAVSKMPRRQQEKILDILEPFVRQHANGSIFMLPVAAARATNQQASNRSTAAQSSKGSRDVDISSPAPLKGF